MIDNDSRGKRKVGPKSCPFIVNTEYLFRGKVTRCYTVNETQMLCSITLRVLLLPERPTVGRRGKFSSSILRVCVCIRSPDHRPSIDLSEYMDTSISYPRRRVVSFFLFCVCVCVCRVNLIIENMCHNRRKASGDDL